MPEPDAPRLPDMSADDAPPVARLGEYKLLEKLGQGGMGTVYKALHTELDRVVAVKVLAAGRTGDEQAVARFKREMKAVGRLDHANLVRAHDAREIQGTLVLVMEFVDGLDLGELVGRLGPLPVADACELVRQAAVGLQYAHAQGLVHRDIKPSNLMLTRHGQVKILDLGLARIRTAEGLSGEMTASGQVMGTPDYIAPEQITSGRAVDVRADVYSLGCTLYKLLTGQAPFGSTAYATAFEKMTAHVRQPVPPVRELRGEVPEALTAILDRMLAKDPEDRYSTAEDVAAAMAPLAAGCDLTGLLARAEGQPVPPPPAAAATAPARAATTVAPGAATPAEGVCSAGFSPSRSVPRERAEARTTNKGPRWWMIAGGLVLLLLAVWIGLRALHARRTAGQQQASVQAAANIPGPGARPVEPPTTLPPGWIVMSWSRVGMGRPNLWLFTPDGSRRLRITAEPRFFDIQPAFSPDGRQIAFVRGSGPREPNTVWVCNADGSQARPVVPSRDPEEWLMSPVWLSDSRLCYTRYPKADRLPDMEVWEADLDGRAPHRAFRFREALGEAAGLVTDASPDGRFLAVIAQTGRLWAASDVLVTDRQGKRVQSLWADQPDDYKDARALWSPDGRRIAWHHNFTRGAGETSGRFGVGMARLEPDGRWTPRLQPQQDGRITPLAWSPDSRLLLCARLDPESRRASLFLMDERFQPVLELFDLEADFWQPTQRDFGRIADWAVVPPHALPPQAPDP